MSLRPDSNGYLHVCDHAGLVCDIADIARRLMINYDSRWRRSQLPVLMAAILNFGSRPTSDIVDSVISESGMAENTGVDVGIEAPCLTVQKLFSLPV